MTKVFTFKKRKDFLRVAAGSYVVTHNIVLQATPSVFDKDDFFVGYTATKKIGNAVCRNKSKRRMRAVVREIFLTHALPHIDYVFIARNSTASCNFDELKQDTIYALKKINKNFLPGADNTEKNASSGIIKKD